MYACFNVIALASAEFSFIDFPPYNPILNKFNVKLPSETIIEQQEVRALPTQFELVVGEPNLGKTFQPKQLQRLWMDHSVDRENATDLTPLTPSVQNKITSETLKPSENNWESRERRLLEHRLFEGKHLLVNAATTSEREPNVVNDITIPVSIASSVILAKHQRTAKPSITTSNHFFRFIKQRNGLSNTIHYTAGSTTTTMASRKIMGSKNTSNTSSTSKPNINISTIKKIPVTIMNRTNSILTPSIPPRHNQAEIYSTSSNYNNHSTPIPNITFKWRNLSKSIPINKSHTESTDSLPKLSSTLHDGLQKLTRV